MTKPTPRYRRSRRTTVALAALAAQHAWEDRPSPLPRPGAVLLCRAGNRDRLVFGVGAIAYALARRQHDITALVIAAEPGGFKDLATLDEDVALTLAWSIQGAKALRAHGLALDDIAALLGLPGRADAQRLVRLGCRPAKLVRLALDAGLQLAHLRHLTTLPDPRFEAILHEVIRRGGFTVQGLRALVAGDDAVPDNVSADLDAWAIDLGKALGTEVKVKWPSDPAQRSVTLAWHSVEELIGILERLGGPVPAQPEIRRRTLTLSLRDTDEVEAVFGRVSA